MSDNVNPHWTQARKFEAFYVAGVQCEHSHSQQQVPFCLRVSSRHLASNVDGGVVLGGAVIGRAAKTISLNRVIVKLTLHRCFCGQQKPNDQGEN